MPYNQNEIEIPPDSRINQVGDDLLAEQARRALLQDSTSPPLHLNLQLEPDWSQTSRQRRGEKDADQDLFTNNQFNVNPPKSDGEDQSLTDKLTDRFIPGFGRLESENPNSKWRLDYLDPGRCKTKASVGICFKMDIK